jgi:nitrite reductase/ring-hydroxylating ferredoxin subunit
MKFAAVLVALACVMGVSAFAPTAPLRALTTRSAEPKVTMMARGAGAKLKYVNAIPLSDLPKPGSAVGAVVGGLDVCIAVGTDGLIYALGGKAPPTGTPLAAGRVSKKTVKDSQYGTEFNLETGKVEGKWCPGGIGFIVGKLVSAEGVPTYKVKKSGAFIQVEVDVAYKQNYESNYWRGILDAQGKTDGGYY